MGLSSKWSDFHPTYRESRVGFLDDSFGNTYCWIFWHKFLSVYKNVNVDTMLSFNSAVRKMFKSKNTFLRKRKS